MSERDMFRITLAVFVVALIAAASTWLDPRLTHGYVPTTIGPTVVDIVVLPFAALAALGAWLDLRAAR